MVALTRRWTWKKWAPDVGENRELPDDKRLYLELATGLTAQQLDDVDEKRHAVRDISFEAPSLEGLDGPARVAAIEAAAETYRKAVRAALVAALGPYVRVHGGPHSVDGQPLATLDDYLALVQTMADSGVRAVVDLVSALRAFNSLAGPDELFSRRLSGGAPTTAGVRVAKADETTAAP